MISQVVGVAFGLATGTLLVLYSIKRMLKKNHKELMTELADQQRELMRLEASVEDLRKRLEPLAGC